MSRNRFPQGYQTRRLDEHKMGIDVRAPPEIQGTILSVFGVHLGVESRGNAMEMAIGIAYAAATGGTKLPPLSRLWFKNRHSQDAWGSLWPRLTALGIRATEVGRPNRQY